MKKWLVLLIVFMLSACSSEPPASTGKAIIKIGYLPITHAAPLYAQASEQYPDYEVELVKFGAWPELMDALNTGKIDGASVLAPLAMKAYEQGIPIQAVALGHQDGNIMVSAPHIKEPSQLKGQQIAIPSKYSSHNILLDRMREKTKLQADDISVVELPPAEMPAALAEGRIAGYIVAEPFGAIAVAMKKGDVLFQSEELWEHSICCLLVLRQSFLEENKNLAEKFVEDYQLAGEVVHKKDDHAKNIVKQYLDVQDEVLDLSLAWISYDDLEITEDAYQVLAEAVTKMQLSENVPTFEQFVAHELVGD